MDIQIIEGIEGELNLEKWYAKGGPGSGHHGHKGRKGKRGGSARSRAAGLAKLSAPTGYAGAAGKTKVNDWLNEGAGYYHPGQVARWDEATDEKRSELKAQVARDLSEASGVSEQEASDFVRQWAHSSNDDDMRSLAIQQDAAKEFGLKTSEFTKGKIDKIAVAEKYPKHHAPLMESDKQRAILRSMYNETQAELESRGITEVRLYRGVGFPLEQRESWGANKGKNVPVDTNALESWSVGKSVAGMFAGEGASTESLGRTGVVMEAVIPAGRILSTPSTGFGCLKEGEVIVLGGVGGDQVKVAEVYP